MTRRALVVDDSRAMRSILAGILKTLDFEVEDAGDGAAALEKLDREGPYDLALIDWNMPEMSGYDVVKAVRSQHRFDSLPLVMVTTETELSRVSEALDAGADEYIMKPFNREMLLEKLVLLGIEAESRR